MLQYLHIKNIALVDEIEIEFEKGFNVVTGETGAGKSVIVGSLNFILGERFDSDQIRSGEEKALIEAVFDISRNAPLLDHLKESGITCDEKEFIIRREISRDGRGRCFVCGSVVPLSVMKAIGDFLVDIHGQHDHQSILNPANHTVILDRFAAAEDLRGKVKNLYSDFSNLETKRDAIVAAKENRKKELDFLKFQLDEMAKANLKDSNEDSALDREYEILRNAAGLKELSGGLFSGLYEDDSSLIGKLSGVEKELGRLARYEPIFDEHLKNVTETICRLKAAAEDLRVFRDRVDINEARLGEVEERISLIEKLKKKYGGTLEQVIACRDELAGKVNSIENSDEELKKIEEEMDGVSRKLNGAVEQLSVKRKTAAKKLSALIKKELEMLGMAGADFDAALTPCDVGPGGAERDEFFISPNKGEGLKPLKNIASGGEISRVMLAIKKIIADTDSMPTLIFDEIDVNIGGRLANTVGERMKSIARDKQLICITHLPQIARCGENHLYVEKKFSEGKTVTHIRKLKQEERTDEIARMLGGKAEGTSAAAYARELLKGGAK